MVEINGHTYYRKEGVWTWMRPPHHDFPGNTIQKELLEHYDNAVAVEMESYGFAKSVYTNRRDPDYNPQYLVVRGISDLVPSASNLEDRAKWKVYASDVAASLTHAVALQVLKRWPIPSGEGD